MAVAQCNLRVVGGIRCSVDGRFWRNQEQSMKGGLAVWIVCSCFSKMAAGWGDGCIPM